MIFFCLYLAYCVVLGKRLTNWDYNVAGQCYNTSLVAASGAPHPLVDHVYLSITCLYMFGSIFSCWMCGEIDILSHQKHGGCFRADESGGNHSHSGFLSELRAKLQKNWETLREPVSRQSIRRRVWAFYQFYDTNSRLVSDYFKVFSGLSDRLSSKASLLGVSLCQFPLHTYMIFAMRSSNEHRLSGDSENAWGFGQIMALVLMGSTLVQSVGTIVGRHALQLTSVFALILGTTN